MRSDLSALHPSSRASFAKRSHSLTYRQPKFFRKHGSDETGFNYLPSSRASFAKRSLCSAPVIASLICEAISLLCTRHRELHLRSDLSPLHPSSRASFAKRSLSSAPVIASLICEAISPPAPHDFLWGTRDCALLCPWPSQNPLFRLLAPRLRGWGIKGGELLACPVCLHTWACRRRRGTESAATRPSELNSHQSVMNTLVFIPRGWKTEEGLSSARAGLPRVSLRVGLQTAR